MDTRWERSARSCQYVSWPLFVTFAVHTEYTEKVHGCGGGWLMPQQSLSKAVALLVLFIGSL